MRASFERGDLRDVELWRRLRRCSGRSKPCLGRCAQRDLSCGALRNALCACAGRCAGAFRITPGRPITIAACASCSPTSRREIDRAAGEAVTAIACDTKPIAERAFAARAGLGWVGKHTNVISPQLGLVRISRRDRDLACPRGRRAAAQELRSRARVASTPVPTRRAARRLHDRRDALHRRPHAAHRSDSARRCAR